MGPKVVELNTNAGKSRCARLFAKSKKSKCKKSKTSKLDPYVDRCKMESESPSRVTDRSSNGNSKAETPSEINATGPNLLKLRVDKVLSRLTGSKSGTTKSSHPDAFSETTGSK